MLSFELSTLSPAQKQNWLLHAIAPRPVCFASTIDSKGNVNLSPFSFFNMFSSNPPVAIFSPSRRVRDNTTKHTLENILEVPEVVINICDEDMVQQVSLASCEYEKGVDEFIKAGFTKQPAIMVKPPMVKEAKIKIECKVIEVKSLGEKPGAGQLVIAEMLVLHVDESILNEEQTMIDQLKIHHIARLGGDWYSRVDATNLFTIPKPNRFTGMGFDALPESIKNSSILSANNLGLLAGLTEMPEINPAFANEKLQQIVQYYSVDPDEMEKEIHTLAKQLLEEGRADDAWQVLLSTV